jgi:hypothetical protein
MRKRIAFLTSYDGDVFRGWQGDLFIGGVRYGEVALSRLPAARCRLSV